VVGEGFARLAAREALVEIRHEELFPVLNVVGERRGVSEIAADAAAGVLVDDVNGSDAESLRPAQELADVEGAETAPS
jgi:hypothetical protein